MLKEEVEVFSLMFFWFYLTAKVRYIEVVIVKLPVMMIHINPEDRNFRDGCSRRLNVLKLYKSGMKI